MVSVLLFLWVINPTQFDTSKVPEVDILEVSPDMAQFLDVHVVPVRNPVLRLQRLVQVVFNESFLSLSYENTETKTSVETFRDRSGNCLSFTNMFVAMARYCGFTAHFQEVENVPTWDRHGNVVVLNRHMNALIFIVGKKITVDFNPYNRPEDRRTMVVSDARALAQYYNNIGAELFGDGQRELALAHFQRALQIEDRISFTWSNLGVAYQYVDDAEMAERCYLKALKVSRAELTAMNNLERLYRRQGRLEEANKYHRRVVRFRKRNPFYHYELGRAALERANYDKAVGHFRAAIRRKPKTHEFHWMLAAAYHGMGDADKAAKALVRAREYAPNVFDKDRYSQKLELMASSKK
ncbi:Tetratricopeptide repeat protein [Sulfidibacter corallicola]|uniref:Tetratricopeptide repeat protein n=1 Tax=Sulfidibacter corallicola TaxID=2818388 RepID=A0A8A4TNB2_SULCO|nr:tetratricopeptide repeat protein [Sulfidibacter corallicola]QTD48075.1 tetratricopeptide repeat protein [Sulfidibacter corallicola]